MLTNGDFEGGFRDVGGVGELTVAVGWQPWWDGDDARPEYKDAAPFRNRIHFGNHAQQWFNSYSKHTAGIYQQIGGVQPGTELTLSAWVQCFSSDRDDFEHSDGRYRMRIGLDPYGGMDGGSDDIVWSNDGHSVQPYDEYELLEVDTVAKSDRATVFIWGQAEWALKHNNAFVDDVQLVAGNTLPPTPGPGGECPTLDDIRAVVREELTRREPVKWPR